MKHPSRSGAANWISFHIFLPDGLESFLVDYLFPALEADLKTGLIKRFFFIRYNEGGYHLRLRLLPGTDGVAFEPRLTDLVQRFVIATLRDPSSSRVEQHQYDRSALYFGETCLSVYAELLNEQTSYLSLRLLRAEYQRRHRLVVVLASTLNFLMRGCVDSFQDFVLVVEDSRRFAENTAAQLGFSVQPGGKKFEASLRSAILHLNPQADTVMGQDLTIQRIIRLLRRTRKCKPSGKFVATHALHLLCNKLGVSILEEYNLFSALHSLGTDSFSAIKKGADHGRMA